MNERIKQLWENCDKIHTRYPEQGSPIHASPELLEKFAELIVEECVQTLINNMPERYTNEAAEEDWDKGYDRAMKDCVHYILDHFGVEE